MLQFWLFNFTLTNFALYSLIGFTLITSLHLALKGLVQIIQKLIPSQWSIALESSLQAYAIVREQIGLRNEIYLLLFIHYFSLLLLQI